MIRLSLRKLGKKKHYIFIGRFSRLGYYRIGEEDTYKPTIMLTNIRQNGHIVADHLWFRYNKCFIKLGKIPFGTIVRFVSKVTSYYKIKHGVIIDDYHLAAPTKIVSVNKSSHGKLPKSKKAIMGYVMLKNGRLFKKSCKKYEEFVTAYKACDRKTKNKSKQAE